MLGDSTQPAAKVKQTPRPDDCGKSANMKEKIHTSEKATRRFAFHQLRSGKASLSFCREE